MEGESRKRKMENEEDDEEEEMEKFFALVRSIKDVRERLNKSQEEEKKKGEGEKPVGIWNPSFQPEDFMEGGDKSKGTPQASLAGPSKREDETKEEDHKEGGGGDSLDLNLSL